MNFNHLHKTFHAHKSLGNTKKLKGSLNLKESKAKFEKSLKQALCNDCNLSWKVFILIHQNNSSAE